MQLSFLSSLTTAEAVAECIIEEAEVDLEHHSFSLQAEAVDIVGIAAAVAALVDLAVEVSAAAVLEEAGKLVFSLRFLV